MHTFFHHSTTHPHESVHSHHQSKRPNFETWSLEMTCSMSTIVCVEFSSGSDITHFCLWIFIHISFGWLGLEVEEVETYRSLRCFYERGVPLAVVQTCENFVTFIKPVSCVLLCAQATFSLTSSQQFLRTYIAHLHPKENGQNEPPTWSSYSFYHQSLEGT